MRGTANTTNSANKNLKMGLRNQVDRKIAKKISKKLKANLRVSHPPQLISKELYDAIAIKNLREKNSYFKPTFS